MTYFLTKPLFKSFDEAIARAECPLLHRPEFCERCDGEPPVCPRVLLRSCHDADPIGEFVTEYMRQQLNQPPARSAAPRPKQNSV